ncbi:biotin--[acetyl-CoA-carboxylase] ligase [Parafrigoribacterium humi]|jgi:BirA family biotin operon repressor/biotin-[acetyl-CoA-carboxylase] ligase|uniref:biotin--[acetyl-CoA-carboxylase] ligase n=1 Tax=Parafrigoribacterium humi TaxID=3144664 RepID=UPI0032ED34E6
MHLPHSAELAASIIELAETTSTNDELVTRAAGGAVPEFSVVLTTSQTAGRGRLGRSWIAPPGKTLAVSLLLRPLHPLGTPLGMEHFAWLPLLAGVAMTRSIAGLLPEHRVTLKWPNDVQVDGKKIAGILAELLPAEPAVVIGVGVNLAFERGELPTETSTSMLLDGAQLSGDELVDAVLSGYLREFASLYRRFLGRGADPDASGLRAALVALCSTLGQSVKVQLPGDALLFGEALDVDSDGRLLVRDASDGVIQAVAAGDVTHLRYE